MNDKENQDVGIYTENWLKNWVKDNKQKVIDLFCIGKVPEKTRRAIFMSGSPGAGKTEIATRLNSFYDNVFVNIEQDKIKTIIPGYTGSNAAHYQKPASKGLSYVMDYVLKKELSFILDTTFSLHENAKRHIEKCIKKNYCIQISYIYQEPLNAWKFVIDREKTQKRFVPKESFVRQFIESRETVNKIKKEYGNAIRLDLLFKNLNPDRFLLEKYYINISNVDGYIKKEYNIVYKSEEEVIKNIC